MDFTSIIGFIAGLGVIVWGMMQGGGAVGNFIDPASVAITIGGCFMAQLIAYPISYWKRVPSHFKIIIAKRKYDPQKYIDIIVEYAEEARRKGLLSLEDKANQEEDVFLRDSIMLIVDAIDPEKVKSMLENELDCLDTRHAEGWGFYEKFATFGPAFGMIGTLIGLINMLKNMDMSAADGATKMANGMSTALVTTFYGSMLANFFMMPFASKLQIRHGEEMLCKQLIVEGVISIQAGENPRHIQEKLNAFVYEKKRTSGEEGEGGEAGGGKKPKKPKKEKKAKE